MTGYKKYVTLCLVVKRSEFSKQIFFLISLLVILALGITFGVFRKQIFKSRAASCGYILLQVSADGKTPSGSISLPSGVPTKYYVHVTSGGQPCSANFDVLSQRCDGAGNNCSGWITTANWGTYRSNQQGIARIDLDGPWPNNFSTNFRVRPAGTAYDWSNPARITFTGTLTNSRPVYNMTDYIVYKPGYTYLYDSTDNLTGTTGTTRIQMEQEISKSGINIIPWRYTKTNPNLYWAAVIPGVNDGKRDLRWFITDPNFYYSPIPGYNNFIWGFADTNYSRPDTSWGWHDINFSGELGSHVYKNTGTQYPSYNLAPKTAALPYINYQKGTSYYPVQAGIPYVPTMLVTNPDPNYLGSWKIRVDKDYVNINYGPGQFNYSGEALRIDYYEGFKTAYTDMANRESWYYVKGIGLVQMISKTFNRYAGAANQYSPMCASDSDCWDDTIQNPSFVMKLKNYFQNPQLTVQVSSDGVNYSSAVSVGQNQGYYLRVSPPYTGYLESGNGRKWLWVDNGLVRVSNPGGVGTYYSPFRIWVPNEAVSGETRINPVQIPWSNYVTVNVTASPGCTSSTWYTGYGFSGYNWCPANNQLCSTSWLSSPQVYVTCGSQRLVNVGTYCTRPDGTKSFTGTSACVP